MAEEEKKDPYAAFTPLTQANESGGPAGVQEGDPYAGFTPAGSSPADKAISVGQGVVGGAAELSPVIAGAMTGVAAAAAIPIPGARIAGGLIGAGIGAFAGSKARGGLSELDVPGTDVPLTRPNLEAYPPDQRPYAVAGEVLGGAGPVAGATLGLAKAGFRFGKSFVGSWLNRVLDAAKNTPGTFLALEASGAGGSAVAGAAAEVVAPGNKGARFGAEVAGGFFNPTRLFVAASNGARAVVNKALTLMSEGGRQTAAGEILQKILKDAGEDPVLLARLLENEGLVRSGQTSAQKTGSEALSLLENHLKTVSSGFSKEASQMADASLKSIDGMIAALRGISDPNALASVAKLEQLKFKTMLNATVQAAEKKAAQTVSKISKDTPEARAEISAQAREALSESLRIARAAETKLWTGINKDIPLVSTTQQGGADAVLDKVAEMSGELARGEKLPTVIAAFAEHAKKLAKKLAKGEPLEPGDVITSGELMTLRSRSLALAREAQAQGKYTEARMYGNIAESVLDSLDTAFKGDAAYDKARGFSRELNEVFTRTFAGQSMSRGPRGADRVPPELMLDRALGTGKTAGAMRLHELENATRFMTTKGLATDANANELVGTMLDAQERLVRLAATDAVDPNTGRVSATRLAKFIKDNAVLLNRFPEVKANLREALKSELALKDVLRTTTGASRVIDQKAAFSAAAEVENSVQAITSAVKGANPERDLKALAKLSRKSPAAAEGLRASVFDHAIEEATITGRLDFKKLRAALFEPVNPGQPSLVEIMQKNDVLGDDAVKQLNKLLDEADKIEKVVATRGTPDEGFMGETSALVDLVTRALGAVGATAVARGMGMKGSGPALVVAGGGSRALRRVMDKVPAGKVRFVLIEASKSPEFMAMLLRTTKVPGERMKWNKQIHGYMLQAGFFAAQDDDEK